MKIRLETKKVNWKHRYEIGNKNADWKHKKQTGNKKKVDWKQKKTLETIF